MTSNPTDLIERDRARKKFIRAMHLWDDGSDVCRAFDAGWNEAANTLTQQESEIERLRPFVEQIAAERTTREILTQIVGQKHLPPQGASERDRRIIAARAALSTTTDAP